MRVPLRRLGPVIGFAAGALMVPAAAYAASAVFDSTSSTPAVTARNTGGGLAVAASGNRGSSIVATSSGTGASAPAIYALQTATGPGASGVSARATGTGLAYGVYGVVNTAEGLGVRGRNDSPDGVGMFGSGGVAGVVGSGGLFGLASDGELGVIGHVIGDAQDIGGACTIAVADQTAKACRFTSAFPTGVTPRVVVTPTSNPGGNFWVSAVGVNGFTINVSSAVTQDTTFNYVVVGTLPTTATSPLSKIHASATKETQSSR